MATHITYIVFIHTHLQWTTTGGFRISLSARICFLKLSIADPYSGTPLSGQDVNWRCLIVLTVLSYRITHIWANDLNVLYETRTRSTTLANCYKNPLDGGKKMVKRSGWIQVVISIPTFVAFSIRIVKSGRTCCCAIVTSISPKLTEPLFGQYKKHFSFLPSYRLVTMTMVVTSCSHNIRQKSLTVIFVGPWKQRMKLSSVFHC